jgi:hypothetical protein
VAGRDQLPGVFKAEPFVRSGNESHRHGSHHGAKVWLRQSAGQGDLTPHHLAAGPGRPAGPVTERRVPPERMLWPGRRHRKIPDQRCWIWI